MTIRPLFFLRSMPLFLAAAVSLTTSACSSGLLKPHGKVTFNDGSVPLNHGETLAVTFYLFEEGRDIPLDSHRANAANDGSFIIHGPTRKGIHPGQYSIGVQILQGFTEKDRLQGAFSANRTPFRTTLSSDNEPIILDIGDKKQGS